MIQRVPSATRFAREGSSAWGECILQRVGPSSGNRTKCVLSVELLITLTDPSPAGYGLAIVHKET